MSPTSAELVDRDQLVHLPIFVGTDSTSTFPLPPSPPPMNNNTITTATNAPPTNTPEPTPEPTATNNITPTPPFDNTQPKTRKHKDPKIKIGTLNINNGRNGRLEGALRAIDQLNFDLGVLTEVKITTDKYTPLQFGYNVLATCAPSASKGGVALFWRSDADNWHIEDPTPISPNTISAILTSGKNQWLIIGSYISPSDDPTENLRDITTARNKHPTLDPIILGNFNANLANPRTPHNINIAALMSQYQLCDPILLYKQKKNRSYTWSKKCSGRQLMTSQCDYTMIPFAQTIIDAKIACAAPYDTDHYAVWVTIPMTDVATHKNIKKR